MIGVAYPATESVGVTLIEGILHIHQEFEGDSYEPMIVIRADDAKHLVSAITRCLVQGSRD